MVKTTIRNFLLIFILLYTSSLFAQHRQARRDTLRLDTLTVRASRLRHLPDVVGVSVFAGKKTFLITPDPGKASLVSNNARMIFAEVPGVNVWEMDGAGVQINIGTRGTDSHRSGETNMRQNGYNTNSDMFGYPEDHYTPPFQGIKEIQIVRGSAALQFGSQFGGMVNYKIKEADTTRIIGGETEQTVGSNRFFNSFNAVGGKTGKLTYYGYYSTRNGAGYRPNSGFDYHAYYLSLKYQFNPKASLGLQFSRTDYQMQSGGGLTDAQFHQSNRYTTRSRNYFAPEINIPALIFNYNFNQNTRLEIISHTLFGQRNSVQFLNNANVADTINKKTNSFNPRQVDRDFYLGFTTEARLLHRYQLGNLVSTFTTGIRVFDEYTRRKQKGTGTTGSDYTVFLTRPYGIDLHLHTTNYAAFAENIFQVTREFSVTPGFRIESIQTSVNGLIVNQTFPIRYRGTRNFPLFGTGLQYQLTAGTQLYGNFSQAYRPYIYANITPADQLGVIDPNLKDSKGYDADLGYRGHAGPLTFDVNAYYVYYGNRIGVLTETSTANVPFLYTTNIGNAVARGIEAYTELSLIRLFDQSSTGGDIRIFSSLAYDHARYITGSINQNGRDVSLVGNHAEGTPDWIERAGVRYLGGHFSSSLQFTFVSSNFSDANNTRFNTTGASGLIPAYRVFDWAFNYQFLKRFHIAASVNNILDARYFTRRINMYPGPGILPADGRAYNVGVGMTF